jgi:PAS domain S-box-containing protein
MFDRTLGFVLRARSSEGPGFRGERYIVAILLVLAATLLRLRLLQGLGMGFAFITFYPAVMLAALYGGLRAGMLATLLSAATADYFFMEPVGSLLMVRSVDWVAMAVFVTSCALMSGVAEKLRQSNDRLRWMKKTQRRELEGQVAARTALLHESEERLAAALHAGKLGVYDYDPRTKIIKWDSTVYRLFGVPEGESVTYETFEAGVHPEDIAAVREAVKQSFDPGGNHHYECEYRAVSRADGTVRWIFADGDVTVDADGPCRLVGTAQDITRRKQAEEALRQSEARYRTLHESLRDAFVRVSMDGQILEFNDLFCQMVGYSREEVSALTYQALTPERWHAFEESIVRDQIMARGYSEIYEKEYRRKDGTIFPVELRAVLSRDAWGRPITMWALVRDISERKKAEAALRTTLESIGDGFLAVDVDWRFVYFNAAAERILNSRREDLLGKTLWEVFPPTEGTRLEREYRRAAAGDAVDFENLYEPWGRWFHNRCFPREGGGMVVYFRDITEQKQAEEVRRESEERLRAIIDTAVDAIVVIDEKGLIQSINPATERIFGYAPNEIVGKNVSILMPDRDAAVHDNFIDAYLRTGKAKIIGFGREVDHRRKDGSVFAADLAVAEWRVGGKRYFTGTIRDITERKRYEKELQLLLREVNHRAKNMLAVVQAIARQTAAATRDEFIERFGERVQALGVSQDLLVKNEWKGVDLNELIRSQLAHFKDVIGTRIKLRGAPLFISASAAQTIGMAIHELATNAGKYGALSNHEGRVEVDWSLEHSEKGSKTLVMSWVELGGEAVTAPTEQGFGTTVIVPMARMSLDAEVDLDYAKTGLIWRLRCPAENVLEGNRSPAAAKTLRPVDERDSSGARPSILVVEDEVLIALDIGQILAEAGFDVVGPASSAAQALDLIRRDGCEAAVLDVNLGCETSERVALELKERGRPFVALVGLFARATPSRIQQCAGAYKTAPAGASCYGAQASA